MNAEALAAADLLPLIVYPAPGGACFLGRRHTAKAAEETFKSGIVATRDMPVRFYLLASFIVIFKRIRRWTLCR
ncbi:MAG: hypothetical protein PHW13_09115 [Methylococcales bacterium]|nr:hypothetical protein [Methylococcales bacterium]